jgi:hypothetical protein
LNPIGASRKGADDVLTPEYRAIASLGQLDDHRIPASFIRVIVLEAHTEFGRLHPHNWVDARVVIRLPAEHVHADHGLFEFASLARQRHLDHEA